MRVKIGWTHFQFFYLGLSSEPERDLELADKFAQEAFADKNMPRVGQWYGHWLKAFVQLYYKRDYERALEEAETTRSEECRVGKEWVRTCRTRWSQCH